MTFLSETDKINGLRSSLLGLIHLDSKWINLSIIEIEGKPQIIKDVCVGSLPATSKTFNVINIKPTF